jgi:uncharacterized protein YjbI with pentapeptide repeats
MSSTSKSKSGGEAANRGMDYQKKFAAYLCVQMLKGKIKRVTCEWQDDIEIEEDSKIVYYQIKSSTQDKLPVEEILKSFNLFSSVGKTNSGSPTKKEYVLVCNKRIEKFNDLLNKHSFSELENDIQERIRSIEGINGEFLERTYLMKGFAMEEIRSSILSWLFEALNEGNVNYDYPKIVEELLQVVNNMCSGRLDQKDIEITYSNESEQHDLKHKTMTPEQLNEIIERNRTGDKSATDPTEEQLQKELKLRNYLKYCVSLIHKPNNLDNRTLNDLYIPNNAILVKAETWNTRDEMISDKTEWNVNSFLNSNQRLIFVSAVYGIGKTSWSYVLAAGLAQKNLDALYSDYIPIHIPLKHGFNRVNDDGDSLDAILSTLHADRNILFIFDALDEYDETEIAHIKDRISTYQSKYINSKAIITTRPNHNFQSFVQPDKYVRLCAFTVCQVNEFYRKYGITLDYNSVAASGLESDEICKPLFCWMISLAFVKNKSLIISSDTTLNRVWLFFTVIHDIILGKHISDSGTYGYTQHALDEKLALRKIAELKHVYGDDLTKKRILSLLEQLRFRGRMNEEILKVFDKLISSYFYTSVGSGYEEHIDFIHRSFEEYLLAEFYIDCILKNETYRVNMRIPTEVTVQFFDGLLNLLNTEEEKLGEYAERLAKTYGSTDVAKLKDRLIINSGLFFENEHVYLNNSNKKKDYPTISEYYENLVLHRWLSIAVLNRLGTLHKLDTKIFFKLLKASHGSIRDYLIRIDNIDLSGHNFDDEDDIPNYNLSKAHLMNSTFHGRFYGTKFSGADLTGSKIEQSTHFNGCDFSGSFLTDVEIKVETTFASDFVECDFSNAHLTNAIFRDTRFSECNFSNADSSGVDCTRSAFSSTDLSKVTVNEKTKTDHIQLLGSDDASGFNREWDDLKSNKEIVSYLLSRVDLKLKEIILRDNADIRNLIQTI